MAALMSDFSLYILCSCARRTGASSYCEVARLTFGSGMECFITTVLFTTLAFFLIAYMVLTRDIWSTIFTFITGTTLTKGVAGEETILLGIMVLCVMPAMLQRSLHALRYNCYVSFASITVLCGSIIFRAYDKNIKMDDFFADIKWYTTSVTDILFALPLFVLSFLAAYNMLPVHCALVQPSRSRVRKVINGAITFCLILFYAFGIGGYMFAHADTKDNILLNFDPSDRIVIVGKIGFGISLALAMPLVTLPARETFLLIPVQISASLDERRKLKGLPLDDTEEGLKGLLKKNVSCASLDSDTLFGSINSHLSALIPSEPDTIDQIIHVGSTLLIVSICFITAVAAPGVAVIWSICGSSFAFIIGFIFPAACYIKLRAKRKGLNKRVLGAWVMLIFTSLCAVSCTTLTVYNLLF